MSYEMDLSNVGGEDDFTASNLPEPGQCHFQVIDVDDSLSERDAIIVNLAVLNGTVEDQRGRRLRESLWMSEKARPRLQHFAVVTGIAKPGRKMDVNFRDAIGKELVGEVVEETYEKDGEERTSKKLSYRGMWSTGNPQVADVPRGEPFVLADGDTIDPEAMSDDDPDPEDDAEDFEF